MGVSDAHLIPILNPGQATSIELIIFRNDYKLNDNFYDETFNTTFYDKVVVIGDGG